MNEYSNRMSRGVASLLLLLTCLAGASAQKETNPYMELYVEVQPTLTDCSKALKNLEDLLIAANGVLQTTTGKQLSFRKATVVIPKEMLTQCDKLEPTDFFDNVPNVQHLTLGGDHPVFGVNPWTQQSRGCGKPGDLLYLPKTYLMSKQNVTMKGNTLIQEWAKYRWGVFEEYGTKDDPIYPLEYTSSYSTKGGATWEPNYCVDRQLFGHAGGSCQHPNCPFQFDGFQNASTSLSSLTTVKSINKFCDKSTHAKDIPTKHNTMCRGASVTEVYLRHPDSKLTPQVISPIIFNYVTLNENPAKKYVLLIDETDDMGSALVKDRWNIITTAIKQWIMEDVLDQSSVGIVTFSLKQTIRKNLTLITSDEDRVNIGNSLPTYVKADNTTCVRDALSFVSKTEATILLVMDLRNINVTTDTAEKMIIAAGDNPVWPLLLVAENATDNRLRFQQLATATKGKMLLINNDTYTSTTSEKTQSIRTQSKLVQQMRRVQRETAQRPYLTFVRLMERNLTKTTSTFQFTVGHNVDLRQPITLMIHTHDRLKNVFIDGNKTTPDPVFTTLFKAVIENPRMKTYDVNITFLGEVETHVVEVLAMESADNITATFWSSQDLNFVNLTSNKDPVVLFVKVNLGQFPIAGVQVSAIFESKGKNTTYQLRDNGAGYDITGDDGIYTAVWVHPPNGMKKLVNIRILVQSTTDTRMIGKQGNNKGVVCCGSSLNLNTMTSRPADIYIDVEVDSSFVDYHLGPIDILPPCAITDLRAFIDYRGLNLNFTAPGDDFDRGSAQEYLVWWKNVNETVWLQVLTTEYAVVAGGLMANVVFLPPKYDALLEYSVTAKDTRLRESLRSNRVRIVFPSSLRPTAPDTSCKSCTGGNVGSFFGGLIVANLVIVLVFFFSNKIGGSSGAGD